MSYTNHDGNLSAIAEPNGPALSEATRLMQESKFAEKEPTHDAIEELIRMVEVAEETTESKVELKEAAPEKASIIPPVLPITNKVYGRYSSRLDPFELELRVDIDGPNALQKISGDYYQVSGQTKTYFGSFIVDSISKSVANGYITVTGTANTT